MLDARMKARVDSMQRAGLVSEVEHMYQLLMKSKPNTGSATNLTAAESVSSAGSKADRKSTRLNSSHT